MFNRVFTIRTRKMAEFGRSRPANGIEPFRYLSELFEQLPTATTVEAIETLLPWNLVSSSPPHHTIVVAGTVQPATVCTPAILSVPT
jgi:hypothetical protein